MDSEITIIDYDAGNLRSVQNMLKSLGVKSKIARTSQEIGCATKIILPGVGNFSFGMKSLARRDLIGVLNEKAIEKKTPILGICLGSQLLTRGSEEGDAEGLGWIAADTRHFDISRLASHLRVPHMGWADTEFCESAELFRNVEKLPRYYYVHSYHMVCDREAEAICHATHGYRFTSGVKFGNIMGVQFHPEKSHRFGKQILENFASL